MPAINQFAIPSTQTAIIAGPSGNLIVAHDVPVIELDPNEVIVKVSAVALNPIDSKMVGDFLTPGTILGYDVAGTIYAVGADVTKDLKPGDRVCGLAEGMNGLQPLAGGFAQYASCCGHLVLKIPDSMSFEAAAPAGTALASTGMAFFYSLKVPASLTSPAEIPFWIFINGGATSTGTMAIQIAKLCNLRPIVTCSPKNFALVKSFGAEAAFDYHSPNCAAEIRAYTRNSLDYAIDCITSETTMKLCYAAIGRAGGQYCALDPYPTRMHTRKVISPDWILATKVKGTSSIWPEPFAFKADMEVKGFAEGFFDEVRDPLLQGKVRFHPPRRCDGGFEGVLDGLNIIRRGEVSGEKLVYPIGEVRR
ncbi:hypothetical protein MMC11_003655 [Xylographa trunciseda]|nr:hypothetical protein [Xylographa trunciseda]